MYIQAPFKHYPWQTQSWTYMQSDLIEAHASSMYIISRTFGSTVTEIIPTLWNHQKHDLEDGQWYEDGFQYGNSSLGGLWNYISNQAFVLGSGDWFVHDYWVNICMYMCMYMYM